MTSGGRHGPAGCRPRWENTAPEDWEVGRYEKNDAVVGPGRTDCARARVARDVEPGADAARPAAGASAGGPAPRQIGDGRLPRLGGRPEGRKSPRSRLRRHGSGGRL